ncbi:MAG: ABC transporter permease subunit [Thiohalocapsa sp.]|uniref:ABC transporter permease subunit n=1 Tax=Thiohalocapsa sp. TaxID=2497641 RepID=UPI0025DB536C|nr:ABC transporter permease subunit [Thiohalocapsa sp.]MCG6941880.1 ABC transporter permease subunit [Thiohalocapsa sp.]
MIGTIALRDWLGAFRTPVGWVLLAATQGILGYVLLKVLDEFTGPEPALRTAGLNLELSHNLFGAAAVLLLLTVPLLAARALGGELRDGTWALLASAPVSPAEILLGKFLGLALLLLPVCLLPAGLGLMLLGAAPVDPGLLAAATLGLWLTGLLFAAVGLFAASLVSQPIAAAVAGYGLLVLLSVVNRTELLGAPQLGVLDWLAWNQHLFWFLTGVVRISDLAYFGLMTAAFLALALRRLDNLRLG